MAIGRVGGSGPWVLLLYCFEYCSLMSTLQPLGLAGGELFMSRFTIAGKTAFQQMRFSSAKCFPLRKGLIERGLIVL